MAQAKYIAQQFVEKTQEKPLKLKDLDEKKRTVILYASSFDFKDSDGDVIRKGAFAKSIVENGPKGTGRIKHLWQHNYQQLVGKPEEMEEDDFGLKITSFIPNTTLGNDTLEYYKYNMLEHSIGFYIVKGDYNKPLDAYEIKEAMLREYSSVTWGANRNTPTVEMKSLSKPDRLKMVNERMNNMVALIRKGKLSDQAFELLDIELAKLQTMYNSLIEDATDQPPGTEQKKQTDNKPDQLVEVFKSFSFLKN